MKNRLKREKNHNKSLFLITKVPRLLVLFVVVLLVIQVVVSNRLATTGVEITEIEQDILVQKELNNDLRQKIASVSSLMSLKDRSQDIGFNQPISPNYLSNEFPVALELR